MATAPEDPPVDSRLSISGTESLVPERKKDREVLFELRCTGLLPSEKGYRPDQVPQILLIEDLVTESFKMTATGKTKEALTNLLKAAVAFLEGKDEAEVFRLTGISLDEPQRLTLAPLGDESL
ncbi:hypothetical protein KBA73_04330 [Patescibacteria group bacterium]|nr:hypothetical protein [Patescibacteria group bacterium]